MEANKSSLLEVLNHLASIHHELRNDQTQSLDIEKLGRLKLLAAQLYMEVDIELLSMEFPEPQEEVAEDPALLDEVLASPEIQIEEVVVAEEWLMSTQTEVPPLVEQEPETQVLDVADLFSPVESEASSSKVSETSPANVSETSPSTVSETVESAAEGRTVEEHSVEEHTVEDHTVEDHTVEDHTVEEHTVARIIGQFPLSRRFEFANILFGGDMENMGLFVQEIIDAPSAAARGDVYDRWFEQKQWRRRDESASDMWRMIKRIFTQ